MRHEWHELKALLCACLRRSRESKTLPPRIGCGLLGSPSIGKDDRLRNYSRPGPKSGVGSNLAITLILLQSQLSRSVRFQLFPLGLGKATHLRILAGTLCRSQTEYRSLMGSRNLLTTGVDMSRDPSSELATEPSSMARPATKDAHS